LNYYIHGENLKYALSFISTISYDAILHYVHELIDFFKSWKMHFLDPKLTYTIDAKNENSACFGDQIVEYKISYWTPDNYRNVDSVMVKPVYIITEIPGDPKSNFNRMSEVIDLAAHYVEHDPLADKDYDGGSPEDMEEYVDLDGGGVHLLTDEQLEYTVEHNIHPVNLPCWPCYNVDAGEVAARIDVYDLDGGGPLEVQRYLDIDGLEITDPRNYIPKDLIPWEYLPGFEPGEKLVYNDIDCGRPDIHLIDDGSIIIDINEYNEITSNVVVNPYPSNGVTIEDDGVMLDLTDYASLSKVLSHTNYAKATKRNNKLTLDSIKAMAKLLTPGGLHQLVYDDFASRFRTYNSVLGYLGTDYYESNAQNKVNETQQALLDWFTEENPYEWIKLEEPEEEDAG
jgi:hypothetical protein